METGDEGETRGDDRRRLHDKLQRTGHVTVFEHCLDLFMVIDYNVDVLKC